MSNQQNSPNDASRNRYEKESGVDHHDSGAVVPTPAQTMKLFVDIFQNKWANARSLYPAESKQAPEFQPERRIIQKMNNDGVVWGLGAMTAAFLGLRYLPDWITKSYARRNNIPYQPRAGRFGAVGYAFGLVFDSVLSVLVGASTTMTMTDVDAIKRELADVPLVEGRSVVSEILCQDYINAYRLSKKKGFDWPKHTNTRLDGINGPEGPEYPNSLGCIEIFVHNCQLRQRYEEELRREQGLSPNQPVVIPSPGVPINSNSSSFEEGGGSSTFEDFETLEKEQTSMEFDMDKRGSDGSAAGASEWVDEAEDMSGKQVEGQSRAYRSSEFERASKKEAETSSVSINDFESSEPSNSSLPEEKKKRRWWGGRA